MKNYYRLMLGRKSAYAAECFEGGFIGADFGIDQDLSGSLPEEWRLFNKEFIPAYLAKNPEKSRISAGLACGALWTVSKGIKAGDLVLCPDGSGNYRAGEVLGGYYYAPGQVLPHRRKVQWLSIAIARSDMSEDLQHSTGSIGTVSNVTGYAKEIEKLLGVSAAPSVVVSDDSVENPYAFAMEKHLEEFLVRNWNQTELGKEFDIYSDDDGLVGQQYITDTGQIDILAQSKDKARLLVIELKRGRASDVVVGQILRYMGYMQEQANAEQTVEGVIIALEDDQRLRRALSVVPAVSFYRYEVKFQLIKG